MSRRYTGDGTEVFRVTVNHLTADGETIYLTQVYGPYKTLAAAKAQVTALAYYAGEGGRKFFATIDRSLLTWSDTGISRVA